MWNQTYLLFGHGLGFSFVLAALPIVTLLLLLGVMRKPAWIAGMAGLGVALLLATLAYGMPVGTALSAAANGAAFGLFPISWIVFWAITLFRVSVETGQFEVIKESIGQLTPDPRLQALLIAFAFGAFVEGAAGFGTPVAIAATMLIGLGFSPFAASAICLLTNTAPVAFGSIGIPIITLAGTTGLSANKLSAAIGDICAPVALFVPLYLMLAMGGVRVMSGIGLPVMVAGAVFALAQFSVSNFVGPQLTDIVDSVATMVALVVLFKFWKPKAPADAGVLMRFMRRDADGGVDASVAVEERVLRHYSAGRVLYAWMPYVFLVTFVLLWGWAPMQPWLAKGTVLIKWPGLHDVVMRMPPVVPAVSPYHAVFTLNMFAASGTACMMATLLTVVFFRMKPSAFGRLLVGVVRQLLLPTVTIASVIGMAFLMNYCGATATLGLALATTGAAFPFFSAFLGWIGVFLTGSDTSANALFGNLQVVTAQHLHFDPVLMAGGNSSGGVMGKMISLQTIAVAAAATGLTVPDQAKLFRFTLRHSLVLVTVTGGIVLLYAYTLHF